MPYIEKEDVKKKRAKIRKMFPCFKFSITRENSTSINLKILEAPFNMLTMHNSDKGYETVNCFYIEEHYKKYPEIKDVLIKIKNILYKGEHQESYDGDYGSIPNFYVHMSIGDWDCPFKVVKKNYAKGYTIFGEKQQSA